MFGIFKSSHEMKLFPKNAWEVVETDEWIDEPIEIFETEKEALERAIEKYRQAEHNENIEKIEFLSRGIHFELDDVYIQAQEIDDKRSLNMEEIQIILESELKAKGLDYKKVKYCVENAKDFILNDFAERQDHFTVKKSNGRLY